KWPAAPAMAAALLLTPTAILTIMEGQSGFLAAGLLVGGIRRAKARPVLGGILLGLLTYKPQLGPLVPLALLAAGWWRCAASASLTTVALVTLSSAAFGWAIWPVWIGSLPGYQAWFSDLKNTRLMPTVSVSLGVLGVPPIVAEPIQWSAAAVAAATTWRCFRDGCPTLAMAALVGATCLANPHAFFYDLPMLDAAVVLLVTQRLRDGVNLALPELLLFLAVLLFPSLMVIITMPLGPLILGLFVARLTALQSQHRARAAVTSGSLAS
ncbi:MAG TPA: glycosyltransferase family 87 protein, partial [Rhodopila sp.]